MFVGSVAVEVKKDQTMSFVIGAVVLTYVLSVYLAPFPHWPTYVLLWKNVLSNPEPEVHVRARLRQITLLVRYFLFLPLWTFLWYLDDVLFYAYKRQPARPVFIFGQPRSGSTLLHRTLASDEETFVALRHIEWRFPYITVQKLLASFRLESWVKNLNYWPNTEDGRKAAKMHPNTLY